MSRNLIRCETEAAWLEARKNLVTASDVAAIMGLSKYKSREEVFAEKTGQAPGFVGNEKTRWGLRLQSAIARGLREEHGLQVREEPAWTIRVHSEHPWFGASLDAEYSHDGAEWFPVDFKNVEFASGWKAGPPIYYQAQAAAQASVVGAPRAALAALMGGCRLPPLYEVALLPAFEALMLAVCGEFWAQVLDYRQKQEATHVR